MLFFSYLVLLLNNAVLSFAVELELFDMFQE